MRCYAQYYKLHDEVFLSGLDVGQEFSFPDSALLQTSFHKYAQNWITVAQNELKCISLQLFYSLIYIKLHCFAFIESNFINLVTVGGITLHHWLLMNKTSWNLAFMLAIERDGDQGGKYSWHLDIK